MSSKWKMFVVAALLYGLIVSSDCHLTGYDCSHMSVLQYGVPISSLLPPCESIRESETLQGEIVQISAPAIDSYFCSVTFTISLVDASGSKREISNGTENISRDTCFSAHETKTMVLSGNHVPFLQTNGTINHSVVIDHESVDGQVLGNHTHHHYIKTYEISLRQVLGYVNLQHNMIRFDNFICDFDNYSCEGDHFGQFFWNPIHTKNYSLIYKGLISFVKVKESMTSPAYQYAVLLSRTQHKAFVLLAFGNLIINESKSFSTELPGVYIILTGYGSNGPSGWESDKRLNNIYTTSYYGHVKAINIARRRCQTESLERYLRLKSSPTFSRVMFTPMGRIGININGPMGSFEVLMCDKLDVVARKTQKCYRDLAVKDKSNKEKFLNPISRVLSDQAQIIPCEQDSVNMRDAQSIDTSLETRDEIPSHETSASVQSTSTEAVKSLNPTEPDAGVDWIKILALVLLGIWGSVITLRLFKLILGYFSKKYHKRASRNKSCRFKNVMVSGTVKNLIEILKPPFMGTSQDDRTHGAGVVLTEPVVTYVV